MLPLLLGSTLASIGSILKPAGIGSLGDRGSYWQLLTETTPVPPLLPCHTNQIHLGKNTLPNGTAFSCKWILIFVFYHFISHVWCFIRDVPGWKLSSRTWRINFKIGFSLNIKLKTLKGVKTLQSLNNQALQKGGEWEEKREKSSNSFKSQDGKCSKHVVDLKINHKPLNWVVIMPALDPKSSLWM